MGKVGRYGPKQEYNKLSTSARLKLHCSVIGTSNHTKVILLNFSRIGSFNTVAQVSGSSRRVCAPIYTKISSHISIYGISDFLVVTL